MFSKIIRHGSFCIAMTTSLIWTLPALSVPFPNPPHSDAAVIGWEGILATATSNTDTLPMSTIRQHRHDFTLRDGTKISTLIWRSRHRHPGRPVIFANFGIFSDLFSTPTVGLVRTLVESGKLGADLVAVDSVTSNNFFRLNHEMGIGGYDEGRILLELAEHLEPTWFPGAPRYLLGVSLGGNAVIQALLEDQRRHLHIFHGAIAFSGVLNEELSSQTVFTAWGAPISGLPASNPPLVGKVILLTMLKMFQAHVSPVAAQGSCNPQDIHRFLICAPTKRIARLGLVATDWNPAVAYDNLGDYVRTSSELLDHLDQLEIPLILVHAKNDPIVSYDQFTAVAQAQNENPLVLTHGTLFGGHWAFLNTYGPDWVNTFIQRMLDPHQKTENSPAVSSPPATETP